VNHNSTQLQYYHLLLISVKRKITNGIHNNAKPVLLLSVFNGIEDGVIVNNEIYYNNDLKIIYENNWVNYTKNEKISPFRYPFYYMKQEDFWHFQNKNKENTRWPKTPTDTFFHENILYATLDEKLWMLLQQGESRQYLRDTIINFFFK